MNPFLTNSSKEVRRDVESFLKITISKDASRLCQNNAKKKCHRMLRSYLRPISVKSRALPFNIGNVANVLKKTQISRI